MHRVSACNSIVQRMRCIWCVKYSRSVGFIAVIVDDDAVIFLSIFLLYFFVLFCHKRAELVLIGTVVWAVVLVDVGKNDNDGNNNNIHNQ